MTVMTGMRTMVAMVVLRHRDDQWMCRIRQPSAVRTSTIVSVPLESISRPRYCPVVRLTLVYSAWSPHTVIAESVISRFVAEANAMSPRRWPER
jgi:hypothetical protein